MGPNTPVVTRIPACAFASALWCNGGEPVYVRVNPEDAEQDPIQDVQHHWLKQGWDALEPLVQEAEQLRWLRDPASTRRASEATSNRRLPAVPAQAAKWQKRYQDILHSLRTPRT